VGLPSNLKETESADVTPGDSADITVDAYAGRAFPRPCGKACRRRPARSSRCLPPDNATGNFTKVVPADPGADRLDGAPDPAHQLAAGMSVVATIKTPLMVAACASRIPQDRYRFKYLIAITGLARRC